DSKTIKVFVDNVLSPLPFRMGEQSSGSLNNYRFEGVGTGTFLIFDEENLPDHHGYVVSFYNDDRWEERKDISGGVIIDQYFSGDGFLTVHVENQWDWPIRLATAEYTYDPESQEAQDDGFRKVSGNKPAYVM